MFVIFIYGQPEHPPSGILLFIYIQILRQLCINQCWSIVPADDVAALNYATESPVPGVWVSLSIPGTNTCPHFRPFRYANVSPPQMFAVVCLNYIFFCLFFLAKL